MKDFPICPLCGKPVNTNTDAFITEQDGSAEGIVKHHDCPIEEQPVQE